MSSWRRKAIELIPLHKQLIEQSESPMGLWIELTMLFEDHVKEGHTEIVRKILNYACWCGGENSGKLPSNTSTAVYCAFYEHIGSNKKLWPYFKEWFFKEEYEKLKYTFNYFLSEKEFNELNNIYYGN